MNRILIALLVVGSGCAAPVEEAVPTSVAETTVFAEFGKDAVVYQHTAAENHYMFRQCFDLARMKLMRNLEERMMTSVRQPKPTAVIVDVDETMLDNSLYEVEQIAEGNSFAPDTWNAWVEQRQAPALPGALEFSQFAEAQGLEIFYVTNRAAKEKEPTIDNLVALGFPNADSAHVLTREDVSDKSVRRDRVRLTHDVLLYVGDQLRDFDERFKDRSADHGKTLVDNNLLDLGKYFVLTPNCMYGTWRDAVTGKGRAVEKVAAMNAYYEQFRKDSGE